MWPVTPRFLEATRASREIRTDLSVTPVDGVPTTLGWESGTVRLVGGTGMRYKATLNVSAIDKSAAGAVESTLYEPAYGEGFYGDGPYGGAGGVPGSSGGIVGATPAYPLISAEGALFTLAHGFKYGTDSELVPMGLLEAAKVPAPLFAGTYSVQMVDRWASLDEMEFTQPYQPGASARRSLIASLVSSVMPGVEIVTRTTGGGTNDGTGVWDRSRTDAIRDLARDGSLECYFDGMGRFIIRDEPSLLTTTPVDDPLYALTTGAVGTILEAERERAITRRYNTVVVRPGPKQTWPQQLVTISDTSNPRHRDRIGTRPFFITAPTAGTAASAASVGRDRLQRLLKIASLIRVVALANPALEPGDIVPAVHVATPTDEGINESTLVTEIAFDLNRGLMDVALVSSGLVDTEEL